MNRPYLLDDFPYDVDVQQSKPLSRVAEALIIEGLPGMSMIKTLS